jgi:TonB family protein
MRFAIVVSLLLLAGTGLSQQQPVIAEPIHTVTDEGIKSPRPKSSPMPDFSREAGKGKYHGSTIVSGYVATDGKFHDGKVVKSIGNADIDAKVLNAVNTWKFHPATKDGKSVNCAMYIEVAVNLN